MSLLDLDDCEWKKVKARTDRWSRVSHFLFVTVEPAPSPQVTPVNSFLSNSLVTDLEGLSLSDTVLSPAVNALHFLFSIFSLLAFTEKTRSMASPWRCSVRSSAHRPSLHPALWKTTSCCTGSQGRVCRWSTASAASPSAPTPTWWQYRCSSPTTAPPTPRACT